MNRGAIRALDPESMLCWIERCAVREDGRVLAWRNPAHEGEPYPEAAALVLHLMAQEGRAVERRAAVAAALGEDVSPQGGLGKNGAEYAFDTAVALAALDAERSAGGEFDGGVRARVRSFVERRLERREALADPAPGAEVRWSRGFACHLIKACARIAAGEGPAARLARSRAGELARSFDGRRFWTCADSEQTYLHANAYALEGLLLLGAERDLLRAGVEWLTVAQQGNGGLPAWYGPDGPAGPERSDATAQAVRLWCCLDRRQFRNSIERGLGFLHDHLAPEGGVYYETGSSDVNVWATVFAAQAARWAAATARPQDLI